MAANAGAIFAGRHQGSSVTAGPVYDIDGNEVEFDVREDEEQGVKLEQIIELLLTAGYFRARIKGLSPFDKIVGGMTWCISTCSVDIDVDLLFQENSTIGQKIALTEKIVAVLPRMKCPHRIEPHQIQGLDFIHIFPIVQWLVKRAIETREEMGDHIRSYSISQFDRFHSMPEDTVFQEMKEKAADAITEVKTVYRPQRKYRRHDAHRLRDEETRVQSTLLEYGRRYGFSRTRATTTAEDVEKTETETGLGGTGKEGIEEEEERLKEEERRIQSLMKGMSSTQAIQGPLPASAVGDLVSLQSQEIQQIASHYADKRDKLELGRSGKTGTVELHKRQAVSLRRQIEQQQTRLTEAERKRVDLEVISEETQSRLIEVSR
ncbi:Coiled-coil domain-containing protein 93 [Lamellibrachia satsuma]|nr:Coiled-coil domain-containing protein 93 [Lamellibrachia satsuma]